MKKPKGTRAAEEAYAKRKASSERKTRRAAAGKFDKEPEPEGTAERKHQAELEHKRGMQQQHFGFVPPRPASGVKL